MREGSVAVGSQLSNPRYQFQLQKTSRPPVPTFPGISSSLGKRPFDPIDNHTPIANGTKRARQIEIPETQRGESLVSSIERDERLGSPELVQATQVPNSHLDHGWQQTLLEPKQESPELSRLFYNVPPATIDELEELPERPLAFVPMRRNRRDSTDARGAVEAHRPNRVLSRPVASIQQMHERSHAPITPPSDVSKRCSTSTSLQARKSKDTTKTPAQRSSASASKFKHRDIYDFPESDIDDSQMSPRSRHAQLSHRKSDDRISRIEQLQSPTDDGVEMGSQLDVNEALDVLENGSVFDDARPAAEAIRMSDLLTQNDAVRTTDDSENDVYEDAQADEDQSRAGNDQDKVSHRRDGVVDAQTKMSSNKNSGSVQSEKVLENQSPKKRRRNRKASKSGDFNVNRDAGSSQVGSDEMLQDSETVAAANLTGTASKADKKAKGSRRNSSLDSPGEQLSQSLRESAETNLSMKALNKKLTDKPKSSAPTPKSGKKDKQALPKPSGTDAKESVSNTVVQRAPKDDTQTHALTKPVQNRGSEETSLSGKKKSPTQTRSDLLTVNKQTESRKSPSIGMYLTEEELKIMKSREGMTKEQYEAEKKRKKRESQKRATEQKRQEAASKQKETTNISSAEKTPKPKGAAPSGSKSVATPAKEKTNRSVSTDDTSKTSAKGEVRKSIGETQSTAGKPDKSSTDVGQSAASSPKHRNSDIGLAPKTPGKAPPKSPSVQSFTVSKTSNPNAQPKSTDKAPSTASKKSTPAPSTKVESKPAKTPAKPTSNSESVRIASKTPQPPSKAPTYIKDLHAVIRNANNAVNSTAANLLARSKVAPGQSKPSSILNQSDDDEEESDSDSDSDEDDTEYDNVKATDKKVVQPSNKNGKETEKAKPNLLGRPDPSIRDKSLDSDDDDDDDDEDDQL